MNYWLNAQQHNTRPPPRPPARRLQPLWLPGGVVKHGEEEGESSYGYHDDGEGYGYEAEDPCYYKDNEAW